MATLSIPVQGASLEQATCSFNARIRSITPLLMHKPDSMRAATGEVTRSNQRRIPTPEEECELGVYRFDDGVLYLPAVGLQRSMIEAGKVFTDPNRKRATLSKVIAATLVPPPTEGYPLYDPESGEVITDYVIDTRRAVVQRNAVQRSRPRIDEWFTDVSMQFDLEALGGKSAGPEREKALRNVGETLVQILVYAGRRVGVGDYRPERSGPYGRYEVVRFEVTDEE